MRQRWILAGAGALAAAAYGVRMRAAVRAVPAELRVGWLYLPPMVPPVALPPRADRAAARFARRLMRRRSEVVAGVWVERRTIRSAGGAAMQVQLYTPAKHSSPSGALLWVHGGDFVVGHPEQDNDLCSKVAADLGIRVVSVDYRLAPEHRFPAAHEDCYAALRWMHDEAEALGIDPLRVVVAGASAGGGLAATVAQHARDDGLPVAAQVLLYPMLDDRSVLRQVDSPRGRLAFTPAMNRYGWTRYLGRRPSPADPGRYAAAARRNDLRGLAPAWLGVGDLDLLHGDVVEYAERLTEAGVPCVLHVQPGMYHGADVGLAVSVPSMHAFRERVIAAVAAATAPR